jgi:hypothetical protein
MDRLEAETLIREATGGQQPKEGDTLYFTRKGWIFSQEPEPVPSPYLGVLSADPGSPTDGQYWYNSTDDQWRVKTAGGIFESPAFTLQP